MAETVFIVTCKFRYGPTDIVDVFKDREAAEVVAKFLNSGEANPGWSYFVDERVVK